MTQNYTETAVPRDGYNTKLKCSKCSESGPKGIDVKSGLCWTCCFPRP